MEFIKEQTHFPTLVHKVIYNNAMKLTPLQKSLNNVENVDSEMVDSCREYFNFIIKMYSHMYQNPTEYGMNAGEYDAFLNNKKENGVKRKFPSKTLELRSKTYNCVHGYLHLLFYLGDKGRVENNQLIIMKDDYDEIKSVFDLTLAPNKKSIFNDIPFNTRLNALKQLGLVISENECGAYVISENFPNMLTALCKLAKSVDTVKTFGKEGFFSLEYRQIWNNHKPDYFDITNPITDESRQVADELNHYLKSVKAHPSITTFWKANYKYKGVFVFSLDTSWSELNIRVVCVYGLDEQALALFNKLAEELNSDEQQYLLRHLNYCKGCSTSHDGGWFVNILGKRKRVCGGLGIMVKNPGSQDIAYIKKFINIRLNIIDSGGK